MAEHYYTSDPSSVSKEKEIVYPILDRTLRFITDHGVFSMDRVDHGSDILNRAVWKYLSKEERYTDPACSWKAADIGCGYGPMAVTQAVLFPASSWYMIDVNDRAMALAYRNAQKNGVIERVKIGTVEKLMDKENFEGACDVVLTNPPIRAGKEVIYQLFRNAASYLKKDGMLFVVIRKNQGAASAEKELKTIFGSVETIDRESGYHILLASEVL